MHYVEQVRAEGSMTLTHGDLEACIRKSFAATSGPPGFTLEGMDFVGQDKDGNKFKLDLLTVELLFRRRQ